MKTVTLYVIKKPTNRKKDIFETAYYLRKTHDIVAMFSNFMKGQSRAQTAVLVFTVTISLNQKL